MQAVIAVVAGAWVVLAVGRPAAYQGDPSVALSLGWLRGDRFMCVLGGLLFVGMSVFNAAATWLDSILGHFGRVGAAGYLIAIMTIAGILGAAVVPQAVAKHDRRRALLQVTVCVTAVAFLAIAALHNVGLRVGGPVRGEVRAPGCPSCGAGLVGASHGSRTGKLGHFAALGEPVWPTVSIVPVFPVAAPPVYHSAWHNDSGTASEPPGLGRSREAAVPKAR